MTTVELEDKIAEILIALDKAEVPKIFIPKGGKIIMNFAKGGTLINIMLNDFEIYKRKRLDNKFC